VPEVFRFLNNLVPRAMPVRGLGWHWLWGNWQPEPLNLGVPVLSGGTLNQSQHRKNSISPEPMPS
jgi:hypothetical protein